MNTSDIESRRAYQREWRRQRRLDPEFAARDKATGARWRERNREKLRKREAERRRSNPAKIAASEAVRRTPERLAYKREQERERRRTAVIPVDRHVKLRKYGLSLDEFASLFEFQGGQCGTTEPGGRGSFCVDHDHSCCAGKGSCGRCIRGLLCNVCNATAGALDWPIERIEAMLHYRENPPFRNWRQLNPGLLEEDQ